jgi:hypothetical protein
MNTKFLAAFAFIPGLFLNMAGTVPSAEAFGLSKEAKQKLRDAANPIKTWYISGYIKPHRGALDNRGALDKRSGKFVARITIDTRTKDLISSNKRYSLYKAKEFVFATPNRTITSANGLVHISKGRQQRKQKLDVISIDVNFPKGAQHERKMHGAHKYSRDLRLKFFRWTATCHNAQSAPCNRILRNDRPLLHSMPMKGWKFTGQADKIGGYKYDILSLAQISLKKIPFPGKSGPATTQNTSPPKAGKLAVCMKAYNNKHYVVAEGDKGTINANRPHCQAWEKHTLIVLNGGKLMHGDKVALRTHWGRYWSAQPNGRLEANRTALKSWETFTIRKMAGPGGKVVGYGSKVAFQGHHKKYIVAEGAGGKNVNANRPHAKQWETFTLINPSAKAKPAKPGKPAPNVQGIRLLPKAMQLAKAKIIAQPSRIRHGSAMGYSFWIQPQKTFPRWSSVLHKGKHDKERGPGIFFHPRSTRLHVRVSTERSWNEGCDAIATLALKKWSHVFVQFRPHVAEVYVNGKLNNRCKLGRRIKPNGGPLYASSPWHQPAFATIRDVRLYTRPLTPAQVAKIK